MSARPELTVICLVFLPFLSKNTGVIIYNEQLIFTSRRGITSDNQLFIITSNTTEVLSVRGTNDTKIQTVVRYLLSPHQTSRVDEPMVRSVQVRKFNFFDWLSQNLNMRREACYGLLGILSISYANYILCTQS